MSKKMCEICGKKPATVPDRERGGKPINRICSECHAERLRADIKEHICKRIDYCICSSIADEPNENCPIHGHGEFPPRCIICGRFTPLAAD